MEKKIQVPFKAEALADLRAGDTVMLSGVIFTSRDKAHKRMIEQSIDLLRRTNTCETGSSHWVCGANHIKSHGCFCATLDG